MKAWGRVSIGFQTLVRFTLGLALVSMFGAPVYALDTVKLQLKFLHQFQFAGYYAALEKGYYREAGLDVIIGEYKAGTKALDYVLSGESQFGIGSNNLLLARQAGKPVVVLGVILQHSAELLLTPRTGSVQSIHDIAGKRVMISDQADELRAYLIKEGIAPDRITEVEHSYKIDDLISGNVYAWSAYSTNETDAFDRAGLAYQAYSPRSAGIDFYGDNLFTSEQEIKAHPARVKAFREASMRGWQYAMRHQEEIVDLILAKYSKRNTREHLLYEARQMMPLMQPDLVEIGYMNPGRWKHISEVYADLGMLPKNVDLEGFLYDPDPRPDTRWLYGGLVAAVLLAIVVWITYLIRMTRQRHLAQSAALQAEEEIRNLNQELEQRVADRTAQLELANKELEAFSYSVSHDLRAPLRHIDGFLSLLKERTGAALDEMSRHYMDTISDAAKHMGTLIDDLLAFSRIGRHEMTAVDVDLGALVQEIIREFEPETRGRDIAWRIADLPVVLGDRAMLRIALLNLISNALKFTQKRPQAEIEIGCLPVQETETVVFVRDNGAGFDMKYADKLFGVFQRLHGAADFEGTGIGLANVRRVIGRHGGRTWAEGKVDGGATFYFSLPQARRAK